MWFLFKVVVDVSVLCGVLCVGFGVVVLWCCFAVLMCVVVVLLCCVVVCLWCCGVVLCRCCVGVLCWVGLLMLYVVVMLC